MTNGENQLDGLQITSMMNNKILIFLILAVGFSTETEAQVDKVMTYNIKYDNTRDTVNNWNFRKSEMVDLIKHYDPDIFGLQEALHSQLTYLDNNLSSYARIGVGRDDGINKGEFCAIYYDAKKLSVINQSTFWLSDKDHMVSVGWDASMERICTFGLFENKANKERVYVFNAHYDHRGQMAREKSSELIIRKIQEINIMNYPVILMGDLNAMPESKTIKTIANKMDDGGKLAPNGIYGPTGTFTGFKDIIPERRIDFIFVTGLEVTKYRHIDDRMKNNMHVSDHLPVLIELK